MKIIFVIVLYDLMKCKLNLLENKPKTNGKVGGVFHISKCKHSRYQLKRSTSSWQVMTATSRILLTSNYLAVFEFTSENAVDFRLNCNALQSIIL